MIDFRQWMARFITGAKRDFWSTFGYPQFVEVEAYWMRYRRDGIASRIIRAYPDACWRGNPVVQDEAGSSSSRDDKEYSAFTEAWEDLAQRTSCLSYLARGDRLARVGHFAIVILGFADGGEDLSIPMQGTANLEYLATYSERSVQVKTWDENPNSPRFGLPVLYSVRPRRDEKAGGSMARARSFDVHFSRVIHIAENTDEDDVFGEPALRPVWNYLLDLEKVVGSSAEVFWLNARGGLSVEVDPAATLSDAALREMKSQLDDFENELRRTIAVQGAKVSPIALQIADPKPNADVIIQLINAATGIPQRILLGSERGELSSVEDANSWESRIAERRQDHVNPNIINPFITRMIETGNIPPPQGNWEAKWPEVTTMSPERQAQIALSRAQAASAWANGAADRLMSREEMREALGMPPDSEYDLVDLDEDDFGDDDDETDDEGFAPLTGSGGQEGEGGRQDENG